jgi:hypothetical protein
MGLKGPVDDGWDEDAEFIPSVGDLGLIGGMKRGERDRDARLSKIHPTEKQHVLQPITVLISSILLSVPNKYIHIIYSFLASFICA